MRGEMMFGLCHIGKVGADRLKLRVERTRWTRQTKPDPPGYGFAAVPGPMRQHWGALIEAYFRQRTSLRGVIVVMDVQRNGLSGRGVRGHGGIVPETMWPFHSL